PSVSPLHELLHCGVVATDHLSILLKERGKKSSPLLIYTVVSRKKGKSKRALEIHAYVFRRDLFRRSQNLASAVRNDSPCLIYSVIFQILLGMTSQRAVWWTALGHGQRVQKIRPLL